MRVRTGSASVDLSSNESVAYAAGHGTPVRKVDADVASGWSRGRLVMEGQRLGDVVAAVGRYYPGLILLTNRKAAERRVNAVIDLERSLAGCARPLAESLYSPVTGARRSDLAVWSRRLMVRV